MNELSIWGKERETRVERVVGVAKVVEEEGDSRMWACADPVGQRCL